MKPTLLLLVAGKLVFANAAYSLEYFVSPHGDDSNPGTVENTPLKTLAKGISLLKPGDTLSILPGEYFEAITTDVSGTAEAPVTIRAQRPGTVTLRGDVEVSGFSPVAGLRHVYSIDFQQRVESVAERASLRTLDPRLTLAEVEMDLGTYFHDEKAGRLYVHCSDSRPPDQQRITVSVTNACGIAFMGKSGVRHVIVDGLAFTGFHHRDYGVQHGSRTRWGLFFREAQNVAVRRCVAYLNSGGIGFLGGGEGVVVEDCRAFANDSRHHSIGCNICGWGVGGATFRRNRVEGHSPGATSKHDITFYSGRDGCVMENNIALNGGLMIKGDLKDAIQRGNVVVGHKFYRFPDETNLELLHLREPKLAQTYADPLNADFRLQSGASAKAVPLPARGDVFYVFPSGDNAAPGDSIGQPWRTLAHAAKTARPGDTIYLLPGVYAESLAPAQSGTAEKPIRFARHGHGLVALDGSGGIEIGADLSGREHIELRGLVLRGHARFGVFAKGGKHLSIEQCHIESGGGDAAAFGFVEGVRFAHNLARDCAGATLRLRETSMAEVAGNVFAGGKSPRFIVDTASAASLWSDRNAFEPGAAVAELDGQSFATLAEWQVRSRLDAHSISAAPGIVVDEESGALVLAADSPLLGGGLHAQVIGPFLRLTERAEPAVEDIAVRGVTDTTASLEWWLPAAPGEAILEWGDTPACANKVELQAAASHSASLAGLKPGATYHFRIQPARYLERLRFATAARAERKLTPRPPATGVQTFSTATAAPAPRTFHVAANGDDANDGLSASTAWRSITHAAAEARAGDTVLIHGGEYEEFAVVRGTGDAGAPLTFRAAPGQVVWMTGSERARQTAILVTGKSHVVIDGFRFRDFNALDGGGQVVRFEGGTGHVVRRCFFDGRTLSGYVNSFLGASGVRDILVENNVVIGGMGDVLSFSRCANVTVRHNVIYIPSIRAITCQGWDLAAKFRLSHNIIFDTLPAKTNNPLVRLMDLENLQSGHNLWFTRTGPEKRALFEPMRIGDKDVWQAKPGSRVGQKLLHADVVKLTGGQDATSRFANPGLPVLGELYRPGKEGLVQRDWLRAEMHLREGNAFAPLDFKDFLPGKPLLAADGRPIGLDPEAFP